MYKRALPVVIAAVMSVLSSIAEAQTLPASCTAFTDETITPQLTDIRAVHIQQLRTCIDDLRASYTLPPYSWSDATLTSQTLVRAIHLTQLRSALNDAYVVAKRSLPQYTGPLQERVTLVRALHITEIRAAARALGQGSGSCPATVTPSTVSVVSNGGNGTVSLAVATGCAWSVTNLPFWLSVTPSSGSGAATLTYSALANTDASSRTAVVSVAGRSFRVTQAGASDPPCLSELSARTFVMTSEGGEATVVLSIPSNCDWSASTSASWMSVSPDEGEGNAVVAFSVAANTTPSTRSGTIEVAGVSLTVQQAGGAEPGPPFSLKSNRDRLLAAYGQQQGISAYQVWLGMTDVARYVFLTITDLLGKRSYFHNDIYYTEKIPGDSCSPAGTPCSATCEVPDAEGTGCRTVTGEECLFDGLCRFEQIPRTNFETALDHVEAIYTISGNSCPNSDPKCECGGSGLHRLWFQADAGLIEKFRNIGWGLPVWSYSTDLLGAHAPYTGTRETMLRQPKGQVHFYKHDFENPQYPRSVEIDIDYNVFHNSNPMCVYSGVVGYEKYSNIWQFTGTAEPADLSYEPPEP